MRQLPTSGLLWFSVVGCGLLAGVYFIFWALAMTAFGPIDQASGIAAMSAINATIPRSFFMPFFLGTTLSAALALFVRASVASAPVVSAPAPD